MMEDWVGLWKNLMYNYVKKKTTVIPKHGGDPLSSLDTPWRYLMGLSKASTNIAFWGGTYPHFTVVNITYMAWLQAQRRSRNFILHCFKWQKILWRIIGIRTCDFRTKVEVSSDSAKMALYYFNWINYEFFLLKCNFKDHGTAFSFKNELALFKLREKLARKCSVKSPRAAEQN